jgi:3-phosphoshikimate 1-carboxyvinyltransferase
MTTATRAQTRIRIRPGGVLAGTVAVPSDKSLSHRALILGALADGTSHIRNFLPAGDTLATLGCIQALGAYVEQPDMFNLMIYGRRLHGLEAPHAPLNCVNAGTGMRLLAGVLAGQAFPSVLDGSDQLRRRPMDRITQPLRQMGANIEDDGHAPLHIRPARLHGFTYELPVASAQVKSCLLLAGLYADAPTTLIEPGPARDHTERMLRAMGADLVVDGSRITLTPGKSLRPLDLTIPGDISSAAFVLVAALLAADGDLRIEGMGINPTRTGILDILAQMGAEIEQDNLREEAGEPVADLIVRRPALHGPVLRGAEIGGQVIVRAIDEFPALMVAATQAKGQTVVRDAAELRVKETDRIAVMAAELRKLGADIEEHPDGFRVEGPQRLRGAVVDGHDDHRVAMALAVAGLVAEGETVVEDAACVADSFPGFVETLQALGANMEQVSDD